MAKKSNLYTRSGDSGETGLVGGQRRSKSDDMIDLYGTCDELNSFIGVLISDLVVPVQEREGSYLVNTASYLEWLQSRLFDLGSLLACEKEDRTKFKLPLIKEEYIQSLELEIDNMDEQLEVMNQFILPGGARAASLAHVCRTVCRRFERLLVHRSIRYDDVPENAIKFINRLSDYFFSLARMINKDLGVKDKPWAKEN